MTIFLNNSFEEPNPPVVRHFSNTNRAQVSEKPLMLIKDPESKQIIGPFKSITWGRGYAYVSTDCDPRWVPGRNVKPYIELLKAASTDTSEPQEQQRGQTREAWRRRRKRSIKENIHHKKR